MKERFEDEHLDRGVEEILDPVDVYDASEEGPNGPWLYRSLTVKRVGNTITVYDVDGELYRELHVPDMSDYSDPYELLKRKLDRLNKKSLEEL